MIYIPPPKQVVYVVMEWQDSYNILKVSRIFTNKIDASEFCKSRNDEDKWERFTFEKREVEPPSPFVPA